MYKRLDGILLDIGATIKDALVKIEENEKGLCFVTEKRVLVGVISDGDLRRYLLNKDEVNINTESVQRAMNRNFVSLPYGTSEKEIRDHFRSSYRLIPLCGDNGEVVDVADAQGSRRIAIHEPSLHGNEKNYVLECIETNWISSQGPFVKKFESEFEKLHDGMRAISVANGTVALHLCLLTLKIGSGDEVIVPNLTFAASINAILYCGAIPVLCDVDRESMCINLESIKRVVTKNTKAIMVVHLYGQVADMEAILDYATSRNIKIIEDCAEALGSKWNGRIAGTFGDAAAFSFFGNKTITTGEGGMVLVKGQAAYEHTRILRDHGMDPGRRYWHNVVGYNYRLTNLQSAVGLAQLERLENIIERKRDIASSYDSELKNCVGVESASIKSAKVYSTYWLYTILLPSTRIRDNLLKGLQRYGIEARPVFYPLSAMPIYSTYAKGQALDNSISLSSRGLSLPSSANLTDGEVIYICNVIKELMTQYG